MSQLDTIQDMLHSHMEASATKHEEIIKAIATLQANEKNNYTTIKTHSASLKELTETDNKRKGILWVLGILWAGMVAIAGWLTFKHG